MHAVKLCSNKLIHAGVSVNAGVLYNGLKTVAVEVTYIVGQAPKTEHIQSGSILVLLDFFRWNVKYWPHREVTRTHTTQAGGFLRPDCAPVLNATSLWICGQNPQNDADATCLDPHISVVHCYCSAGTPAVLPLHGTIGGRLPEWQTSKCISSVSFVRIESNFFLQYIEDTDAKNDGPEFRNSNSMIFENFLKFSKRCHATICGQSGPLWSRPN